MTNRNYAFDILRLIAALMIVLCHIIYGFSYPRELGYYFSGTFVYVFILLSGYLLGLKYDETTNTLDNRFLKNRFYKLIPTYYIYLIISFLLIYWGGGHLSIKQIVSHFTFLNWFIPKGSIELDPLPQLGHLWFMSCIILCYMTVYIVSKWTNLKRLLFSNRILTLSTLILIALWTFQCIKYGKFEQFGVSIISFTILFFRGKDILNYFDNIPKRLILFNFLIINAILIIGYCYFNLVEIVAAKIWLNLLCALSWIIAFPRFFIYLNNIPVWIKCLSGLSFEIYLIHHPFTMGKYGLSKFMPDGWAIITILMITISLAFCLNKLVTYLKNIPYIKVLNKI